MTDNIIQLKNVLSLHIEKLKFYDENGLLLDDSTQKNYIDLLNSLFSSKDKQFYNEQEDYAELESIFSHDDYKLKVKTALASDPNEINEFLNSIKSRSMLVYFEVNPSVLLEDMAKVNFNPFSRIMITLQIVESVKKYKIIVFYC